MGLVQGVAIVDGRDTPLEQASISVLDPGFSVGWAVFETLVAISGVPDNLLAHLDRLEISCAEAAIAPPDREAVEREVHRAARQIDGHARVRVTITAGGARVVVATPLDTTRRHRPVTAVRGVWREDPYLPGSVKHTSRASWNVAVRRAGVDEVLLVDGKGRILEGTTSAVFAVIEGVVWTAPQDGRILGSTTARRLMERTEALGLSLRLEAPPAAGPWDALYIASVSRHLAPVTLLDGVRLPGWDPVGRRLAGLPVR
jgi:branched-subunit amino acid aminotransferase/4-amino-4-deoxychorismate lyase